MSGALGRVGLVGWPQETNLVLAAAWRERGIDAELLEPAQARARLGPGDVAVMRLDVLPTLDGVQPGLEAADELAGRGVRMVNGGDRLLAAHDKLRTTTLLARAGVPQPRTVHITSVRDEVGIDLPLVVKPRFGSWGADVFRCETEEQFARVLDEVRDRSWFVNHGALVQELLPPVGHDLRLVVAAGRVVGALSRFARPREWRTNTPLGGTRRRVVPSEEACALGVRAAGATGLDLVGIDLFPVRDGHVVLELNGAVEFDDCYSLPGSNIYDAVADALELPRSRNLAGVGRGPAEAAAGSRSPRPGRGGPFALLSPRPRASAEAEVVVLQEVDVPPKSLESYELIVARERIDALRACARPLAGLRVAYVSATAYGGGSSELLHSLVPLNRSPGVAADWLAGMAAAAPHAAAR